MYQAAGRKSKKDEYSDTVCLSIPLSVGGASGG